MKIYLSEDSNITVSDVWKAGESAEMWIEGEHRHGSRYADVRYVIEFNGYGSDAVHSARRPNTRDQWVRKNYYAATWDQWGLLLSVLFDIDPDMKVGGYKHPYYTGADDFHRQTDGRFSEPGEWPEDFHGDHTFKFGQGCTKCSARRVW